MSITTPVYRCVEPSALRTGPPRVISQRCASPGWQVRHSTSISRPAAMASRTERAVATRSSGWTVSSHSLVGRLTTVRLTSVQSPSVNGRGQFSRGEVQFPRAGIGRPQSEAETFLAFAQRFRCAHALDRFPGPLGDVLRQRYVHGGPATRLPVINPQNGDELPVLDQRRPHKRADLPGEILGRHALRSDARVRGDVVDGGDLAGALLVKQGAAVIRRSCARRRSSASIRRSIRALSSHIPASRRSRSRRPDGSPAFCRGVR